MNSELDISNFTIGTTFTISYGSTYLIFGIYHYTEISAH